MVIEVDRDRCEGFGFCEQAAPSVFELDENGELHVLVSEVPSADEPAATTAIHLCPVAALHSN
ncbi:ferredoxin [Sciscionella marina]|uniref:ferredoxin n=1 Tax=Sciscionella marina TaxID=508770 RepID=UPI00037CD075|nr:ferredoxin [Sciscionella marina]